MNVLTLKRIALRDDCTLGVLLDGTEPFALTMELGWHDNKHDISCIPKGEYLVQRTVKIKHGLCFEILNVPNRSDILIHKGNFPTDSRGCIILGEQFGQMLNPKADKVVLCVQASGDAYSKFIIRLTNQDTFKLVVCEPI